MNRVGDGRRGRKRLARLVPATHADRRSPRSRKRAATVRARRAGERMRQRCRRRLNERPGMATGTGAAYFDDGTPLVPRQARNAGSIPSRNPGRVISGRRATRSAPRGAMAAVERASRSPDDGLALLFDAAVRQDAARSRLYQGLPAGHARKWRPVHARRLVVGDRLRDARRGRQGGGAAVRCSTRSITRAHRRDARSLQGRTLCRRRRYLFRRRRMSDAAAGPGTRALPAGCIARGWSTFSAFTLQGGALVLDPCVPTAWPDFQISYRYRSSRYEIVVENPRGVSRGVARAELDGKPLPHTPVKVPLIDDGAVHNVRVVMG